MSPANPPAAEKERPPAAVSIAAPAPLPSTAIGEPPARMKVVTQRVTSGRLLVDAAADKWKEFGRGLVLYLSFTKHAREEGTGRGDLNFRPIVKSLLTANLSSSSGNWSADHSDAASVLELCRGRDAANRESGNEKHVVEPQHLILIPQASLVAKLPLGEKTLKYHAQSSKELAEALYTKFAAALREYMAEQIQVVGAGRPVAKKTKGAREGPGGSGRDEVLTVPPNKFFESGEWGKWLTGGQAGGDEDDQGAHRSAFSRFDDVTGFPTHDAEGNELAKSKRKKLEKMWDKYKQKWEKQLAKGEAGGPQAPTERSEQGGLEAPAVAACSTSSANVVSDTRPPEDDPQARPLLKDSELILTDLAAGAAAKNFTLPRVIVGTFGGRQGLELVSGGPFTHTFSW
eukprot:g5462.t1